MSANTVHPAQRRRHVTKIRAHDYLYDSSYIVSGARDYARTAFKSAMTSAQVAIQPIYKTMFSELPRLYPRIQIVYHPNCRLPHHVDRSYSGYVSRTLDNGQLPLPQLSGRDRFMFSAVPKQVLPLKCVTPDFRPPSYGEPPHEQTRPVNKGIQTLYRESSAQTHPWQPDGRVPQESGDAPEILHLKKLEWGPGKPYRLGDLPADFHTTEIINKMRHARAWTEIIDKGTYPQGTKRREDIIADVETRDWLFREAEIDELQNIRLSLLHKLQSDAREGKATRYSDKLAKLWAIKKEQMVKKINNIHRNRDREVRKLSTIHGGGNRTAKPRCSSAASVGRQYDVGVYAPLSRHGYRASTRHAKITYDLSLLEAEDHKSISTMPTWVDQCSQNLNKSCSGHHLPRDLTQLCERETKWDEHMLETLHNDLKKARLGVLSSSSGPLRILKRRQPVTSARARTPELCDEDDSDTQPHALTIQSVVKGRAVQNLMYEGRARATELIEELKSTHGLQKEDRARIAEEEAKARDYHDTVTQIDKKEAAISALVEELCGGAVSAALDFLDKELRRLKEERRQHAFLLVALRDKVMREAAEAGRRQKEEQRRKEHDQMFSRVIGVTQQTVDTYLRELISEGIDHSADLQAEAYVMREADKIDASLSQHGSMSTAEQNEMIAELVHHFLLPEAHKEASRQRIDNLQRANMAAARDAIFNVLDGDQREQEKCTKCGDVCHCHVCPIELQPEEKSENRNDPRWKFARRHDEDPPKDIGEKFPPHADFRNMLNHIVDEAVQKSRFHRADIADVSVELENTMREKYEVSLDAKAIIDKCVDEALGIEAPPKKAYHHYMKKQVIDALERSQPFSHTPCPEQLPSEIRRSKEDYVVDTVCKCDSGNILTPSPYDPTNLLPSEVRILEEFRKCKCDHDPIPSPISDAEDLKEDNVALEEEDVALEEDVLLRDD